MPSIANQDFKIYGKLSETNGVYAKYCGELYAAFLRCLASITEQASFVDGFVFASTGESICRLQNAGANYIEVESEKIESIGPSHSNPAYYDALWAIQQAIYEGTSQIASGDLEFGIGDNGRLNDAGYGTHFVNEDGYVICGTSADGKLASLYLGEKDEDPENRAVVRLESLLPLIGELPLETTEIW